MQSELTRPIVGIENRTAQEVFDIMCDRFKIALSAAEPQPAPSVAVKEAEPVAWRCKDFADGWILDHSERSAREYQRETGCLIQPLYTTPPTVSVAIENLSDEQIRHIADAKDVTSCRSRIRSALSALSLMIEKGVDPEQNGYCRVIDVEKFLCAKLGKEWSATGMSIVSLVEELSAAPARQEGGKSNPVHNQSVENGESGDE